MTITFVGTTIGNLEDISLRALKTLFEADIVLAEDTRVYAKFKGLLLERLSESVLGELEQNQDQKIVSYRDQNHSTALPEVLSFLQQEKKIAVVSDAGMPGISDPGYKLIRDLYEHDIEIDVIPGPSAVNSALLLSGLPTDRYLFGGFLPRKAGRAKKLLEKLTSDEVTVVLFESPFRVVKTIELLGEVLGEEVEFAAVTEITKLHQAVHRGTPQELLSEFKNKKLKGEWVICYRLLAN